MPNSLRTILHLPPDYSTADHADLVNAVWAIAPAGSSVEVEGPDVDAVHEAMDAQWKDVPQWDAVARAWKKN